MKKVLHLNANSAGGAFVAANRLSEALNATGEIISHHLVFDGTEGNGYELWADGFLKKKLAFALHAAEKLDFLRFERDKTVRFAFSHALTGINITSHPRFKEADIIHLHWINKGFISLNGLERILDSGKKVVWTCHDMWPFTGGCYHNRNCDNYLSGCGNCQYLKKPGNIDLSYRKFQTKSEIYRKSNGLCFVTPSAWLADQAALSPIVGSNRIAVIPNGIDTKQFSPGNIAALREKYGISLDERILLFAAANLSNPYKGFTEFNEMLDALKQMDIENIRIVMVGENKTGAAFSQAWPIQETGYVSSPDIMADWYRIADFYVTTSLEENLPTTIMESLACGTPVAAFGVGGIPEMIIDGKTGVIASLKNSVELAVKIKDWLMALKSDGDKQRQICRDIAVDNWDSARVGQQYLELYCSLK
jgi:glycosyltransferase involved in cell wall biosynthesis